MLEGNGRSVLDEHYPDYVKMYFRFRDRNGPACPYCIGVLKNLFMREHDRLGASFLKMFESKDWSDYA